MLLVCIYCALAQPSSAQGFEITFGGTGTQICNDMTISTDSSIYLLGYTSQGAFGGNDFMLSKISTSGQLLWTTYLGTQFDDVGMSVIYSSDQKLVLAGVTHDTILNSQVLIIVTDTSGVETSRYTFGTIESESINAAKSCPDGGYLLAGYQTFSGTNYAYVLKLDSAFNEQWTGVYGSGVNDYASEAIMSDSNSFYIVGDRRFNTGPGLFDYDVVLIHADSSGILLWDSVYHDPFQNGVQGIFQNQAGNLVFFGETEIFQFSAFDYFIASANPDGQLMWGYTFGGAGSNALFDVLEDASGNLVGAGYGNSSSNGIDPLNLSIVKIDTLGNLSWQREYGFQGVDVGYTILEAPGSGYLISGRATTVDGDDFYLLRVDDNGLTNEKEVVLPDNDFIISPNPFSSHLNVSSSSPITGITLLDALGRKVFEFVTATPSHNFPLGLPHLAPGIYIAEARYYNLVKSRSIIVRN